MHVGIDGGVGYCPSNMSGYRDACSLEHERDGYLLNRSAKGEAPNRCQLIFGLPGIQTVLSYDLDEPSPVGSAIHAQTWPKKTSSGLRLTSR